ncbi:hypothetical protein [Bifidobacterium sp. SO1]|uniref:hypothetical protein n=1 Tax=Bifidobacterium sp. SO1 TaxID=2809029 RepID=UPI001BDCEF2A|nr:hypothetical protein [Bifidobacterium sp. SO1]MBT1162700.1 hypothetical protein [Bifidobacterium sp. SO1]
MTSSSWASQTSLSQTCSAARVLVGDDEHAGGLDVGAPFGPCVAFVSFVAVPGTAHFVGEDARALNRCQVVGHEYDVLSGVVHVLSAGGQDVDDDYTAHAFGRRIDVDHRGASG